MLAVFGATISPEPKGSNESRSSRAGYSLIVGLTILIVIIIVLLSTPEQITSKQLLFIDSELSTISENRTIVLLRMDLSSSEQLKKFPLEFGDWKGWDSDASSIEQSLGADCLLMRVYRNPGFSPPIFLLVVQSKLKSSFHPPPVCYSALGWTIEEEGKETIPIVNTAWAVVEKPEKERSSVITKPESSVYFQGSIPAKRLVVFKGDEETVRERRVVLYFYLKDSELFFDRVTMIRVSALAPVSGPYDETVNIVKEFTSDVFPYMFEIQQRKPRQGQMIIIRLVESGLSGRLLVGFLFSIPLAILIYSGVRRHKTSFFP